VKRTRVLTCLFNGKKIPVPDGSGPSCPESSLYDKPGLSGPPDLRTASLCKKLLIHDSKVYIPKSISFLLTLQNNPIH
jgi:hypothetical protein